jgi:cytoskeletal protein CcmA (bactofilin family)
MVSLWGKEKKDNPTVMRKNGHFKDGCTYLGKDLNVKGIILGNDDLRIDGFVEGKLDLDGELEVGQTASIEGDIIARVIAVGGKINGRISAMDKLRLENTARIKGTINTASLSVAEGALFNGEMKMGPVKREAIKPNPLPHKTNP